MSSLLLTNFGRHKVFFNILKQNICSKRSLFQSSQLKQFLQTTTLYKSNLSLLNSKISTFHCNNYLKLVYVGRSNVQHRIVNFFSTKSTSEVDKQLPEPVRKSVWKSTGDIDAEPSKQSYRDELYRQMSLDSDLGKVVKQEMLLYQMPDKPLYRFIFVLVIFQYVFWAFCANILFMFYSGVDTEGNKLRDLYREEKKEKGKEARFWRTWLENISASGYQALVQGFFLLIGTLFAGVMMFLLTRVVSYIRLMPGAKQVKIGHLNMFGGKNTNRFKIFNLSDLSSVEHRLQRVNYISLRARDKTFSYLIDRDGIFANESIYDQTIGVQRKLSSVKSK